MTTVVCVWVKGHVPFTPEYVTRLQSMVERWIDRPHRFVCLTDQPHLVRGVETIRVPTPAPLKGWWSKIELYNPTHGLLGRVLYLDLDTLIVGPLGPILDFPAAFALVPDAGSFVPHNGRVCVKRFNSSVMVWNAGCNRRLFDEWTPAVAKRLWGDQDFIGEQMPDAETFPAAWCPRLSEVSTPPFAEDVKVILSKVPKNHIAAKTLPWFRPLWGGA